MEGRSIRANMLANTAGSILYYFCVWATSVLVVRLSGFTDAGIFSVAMTVTASPAIFGLFNVRSYQVSDLAGEYADRVYIRSRVWTNLLSFGVCLLLAGIYGYFAEPRKLAVICAYMVLKMAEAGADVYHGIFQKKARLDYAGISLGVRGVGSLVFFILGLRLTGSLLTAVALMSLFSVAVVLVYDRRVAGSMIGKNVPAPDNRTVFQLILRCIPLAVVSFLNNLSLTVPRTYLEKFHGEDVMGYYASVSAPTIVVQLAAVTLFAPLVPMMTAQFSRKDKKGFLQTLGKFLGLLAALSVLAVVLSIFLAEPVLVVIFGEKIRLYAGLFIPILLSAALIAVNASLFSVCTLMRVIQPQYLVGAVGIAVSLLCSFTVVRTQGMMGVIVSLFATLFSQIFVQTGLIWYGIRRMGREE